MARPQKQTVDYFPHDGLASEGTTLTILESKYGNDGYAFWFKLLERLCSTPGHFIDCRNPVRWEFLLAKTHVSGDIASSLLTTLSELEAIDKDLWLNKIIWCQNLINNISDVYKNRRALLPQKPSVNGNNPTSAVVSTTDNTPKPKIAVVSTGKSTQSKLKETKVNYINKSIYGQFKNVLLTDDEKSKLVIKFGESGLNERIENMSCAIESKGYKYKSHYAAILNWDRMDNKRNGTNSKGPGKVPTKYTKPEELLQ